MPKPVLSIGMIFKNEIRCLERCMKSLQPLRDAVPCELIMADTGSDDGSREIAERYADIVFDFPWIDDFAAARNAVMDRARGDWFLTIDADEWFDENISGVSRFLLSNQREYDFAAVSIRNYKTAELERGGDYSDFTAVRVIRTSLKMRYVGAIHERWPVERLGVPKTLLMDSALLHHDGYVRIDRQRNEEKLQRNMTLLKKELEKDPEDLTLLMQCIESSLGYPGFVEYNRRGVDGVLKKNSGWELFGPPVLRYAVIAAYQNSLPELDEWIKQAEELFPDSVFTRIDVQYMALGYSWDKKDYADCIRRGGSYLQAVTGFKNEEYYKSTLVSTLMFEAPSWQTQVKILLAAACLYEKQPENTLRVLGELDASQMNAKHIADCMRTFCHLHSRSRLDTAPAFLRFWEQSGEQKPTEEQAKQRRSEILRMAADCFVPAFRKEERENEDFCRPSYTLFLPLPEESELGIAARILECGNPAQMAEELRKAENLERMPVAALEYALRLGVPFPDRTLAMEEADSLAFRLAQDQEGFFDLIRRNAGENAPGGWQEASWTRALALAAVRVCGWKDEEQGMTAARFFARVEREFLPRYYAAELFCDENIQILPPLHRFGWYCGRAFDALDGGDAAGYVRLLREGLTSCESMKPMVEFLLEHTPELQIPEPKPSGELMELAGKVRGMLAAYAPDDPAVAAIKGSPVYQKVARLIEGPELAFVGGLKQ